MRRFGPVERTDRVTFTQLAKELGMPRARVAVLLKVLGHALHADRLRTTGQFGDAGMTYDANIIPLLRALDGQQADLDGPDEDWLARHERGS